MSNTVRELRTAIGRNEQPLYALAQDADMRYAVLHRIANSQLEVMTLATAENLAAAIGIRLELRLSRTRKGNSHA